MNLRAFVPTNLSAYPRTPPQFPESVNQVSTDVDPQGYSVIETIGPQALSVPFGSRDNQFQSFRVGGDHLFVERLNGTRRCYVRFDSQSAAPIELHQGLAITRKFSQLFLAWDFPPIQNTSNRPGNFGPGFLRLYASFGELVTNSIQPPDNGLRRGFWGATDRTATSVPILLWEDFFNAALWNEGQPVPAFFSRGGFVVIKNTGDTNPLIFQFLGSSTGTATPFSALNFYWYELAPGERINLDVSERFSMEYRQFFTTNFREGIYVATKAPGLTTTFAYLLSDSQMVLPGREVA